MAYAEMSSALPKAGSIYNFARVAFGRGTGFTAGWISWFASSVAGSLYAVVFSEYTLHYLDVLGLLEWLRIPVFIQERGLAVVLSILFIYINYRGVSTTGRLESLLTLGQTLTLGFIGAVGVGIVISDSSRLLNFQPFFPCGIPAVLVCMGFEYIVEASVVVSSNPSKTILQQTSQCDLVVIGAPRDAYWLRAVMGTISENVGKGCTKPLIMVKAKGTIKALFARWI